MKTIKNRTGLNIIAPVFAHLGAVLPLVLMVFLVSLSLNTTAFSQTSDNSIQPPEPIPEFSEPDFALPETDDIIPDGASGDGEVTGFARTSMPEIFYSTRDLPLSVKRMHELIREAAASGDPALLRPLIGTGANTTQLSLSGFAGDPIEYLKGLSGDEAGLEILAIMMDILDAGFVRLDEGTSEEVYVWPYFAAGPLNELTPVQMVELFRVVTAGDLEEMQAFGAYNFYRIGISPSGQWRFFVAGD